MFIYYSLNAQVQLSKQMLHDTEGRVFIFARKVPKTIRKKRDDKNLKFEFFDLFLTDSSSNLFI